MKFRLDGRGGRFVRSSALPAAEQAEALLAAATSPLDATYEMTQGSAAGRAFYARALEVGYREIGGSEWPFEGELGEHGKTLVREGGSLVAELPDGSLVWLAANHGWFRVTVAAPSRDLAEDAVAAFADAYPALYRQQTDEAVVPVTFWTYGKYGPQSRLRMIEASPWAEVERNYSSDVRAELDGLMSGFEPGKSGQLLLWQGPPGTGKTWALRALASEWRSWAEFNYITDPDAFFVTNPDYLIDVLLNDSYEELAVIEDEGDPELVTTDRLGKWRVLILEDTGELLAANAKESYGQGLSRLLNVVDGLVGQGLRILVLVTTNDELGELHPAVKRPGRCASQIEFGPLSAEDATAWLGEETDEGGTLAELYARRGGGAEAPLVAAAFEFNPDQPRDDYGRWTGTFEHAYNGETSHSWEGHREEIPAKVNEIVGRAEGGPGMIMHANVEDAAGNHVYRYSGMNGGEFVEPDGSQTAALRASAADGSGGAMVALYPTPPQADALAMEGGQAPEDLHVTLVYLGQAADVDAAKVRNALGADLGKPLGGSAGEVFQFPEGDDGVPLNVAPSVPGLEELRAEVLRRLEAAGIEDASSYSDWTPHICLAYDGDPEQAATKVGLPLSFDSLSVCVGDDRTDVPLAPSSASETDAERWDRLARSIEDEIEEERAPRAEETSLVEQSFAMMGRMIEHLAARPAPLPAAAPVVHVHNHDPDLSVNVHPAAGPSIDVHNHLPEQEAPQVDVHNHIPEQAPPRVEVTVEPPEMPAPHVSVAAPEVHVAVEQPRASAVRAVKEDDGSTVFTIEESEEQ